MLVDTSAQRLPSTVTEAPATPLKGDTLSNGSTEKKQESLFQTFQQNGEQQQTTPDMYARERQSKTPEIASITKNTCADALLMQYQALLNSPAIPKGSWYEDFQQIFEAQYAQTNPGKDPRKATQDELKQFALGLAEKDQFQAWGIKVAEEMQMLMEGSFGAYNAPLLLPEQEAFEAENMMMDDAGNIVRVTELDSLINATPFHQRILAKLGFNPVEARKQQQLYNLNKNLDTANRVVKDTNAYFAEEGRKENKLVSYIEFSRSVYSEDIKIDNQDLNDVQKAFLRRMAGVNTGSELQRNNREQISNLMQNITAARRNFYAHHDRQLTSNQDFRFLQEVKGKPNEYTFNAPSNNPTIMLDRMGFAVDKGTRPEVAVGISATGVKGQLDIIQDALQEQIKVSFKEAAENASTQSTREVIEAKITELQEELGQPIDKAEEERLTNEIAQLQKDIEAAQEIETKEQELNNEKARLQRERDELVTANSIDETPGTGDIAQYETLLLRTREMEEIKRKLESASNASTMLSNKLKEIPRKLKDKAFDPKTGNLIKETYEDDPIHDTQRDKLNTALETVTDEIIDLENQRRAKQLEIDGIVLSQEKQDVIKQIKAKEAEIKKKEDTFNNLKTSKGVSRSSKDIQADIDQKTDEKNGKRFDERFIQQRLDAYNELKDRMESTNMQAIQQRAMQPLDSIQVKEQLKQAQQMYPNVPVAYLRTLHIIYGPEVTMLTPAGKALFERATKLIPPETFLEVMVAQNPTEFTSITSAYDTTNLDAKKYELLAAVNEETIKSLFTQWRSEAISGDLGKEVASRQQALRTIYTTPAEDYAAFLAASPKPADVQAIVEKYLKDFYQYDSIEDLAQKIKYHGGKGMISDARAKMFAIEVDKLRKKI